MLPAGAEESLLLLLGAVVPVTNFLGGCTWPFLQQNAQFATFLSMSWIFFFFEDFNPFIWKLMLEGRGNELLAECGILLHRELQMNVALSAVISVENTPQAWDAATCADPLSSCWCQDCL